jgi:phosphoribosylformimino-5-aminoimidazole carboxamide ribotide isomerase
LEIIPVIDLLNQDVVHARRGERQHYRSIRSSLCASSAPLDIVEAILGLYPFTSLYIADLSAIQKLGHHVSVIKQIRQAYPALRLWVDAGIADCSDLERWQHLELDLVIGSESISGVDQYLELKDKLGQRMILSLDLGSEGFRGPSELMTETQLWPERVIAMTLAKVGSAEGPDLETIKNIKDRQPGCKVFAAGGVRDGSDFEKLENIEVSGALVASAIHDGSLFSAR